MTLSHQGAERNIKLQTWINFLSGIVFLIPIITLFYKYIGLSLVQIILISNISTIVVWLFEIPTAVFADTTGRKKSLIISIICNFLATLTIFIFPSFIGFIIAAVFSGLYWSFWSGTGQAFLEENLRIMGKEKEFGKKIGHLMSLEKLATLITPLLASGLLKLLGNSGYTILACLDVIFAFILILLTIQLQEVYPIYEKFDGLKKAWNKNIHVAQQAFRNIFSHKGLKLLLIYRSLSNHMSFFFIISLPTLVNNGMQEWVGGIVTALAGLAVMVTNKYAYIIAEKKDYNFAWVMATIAQAIILIIAGLVIKSWISFALIFILFNFFEGLWMPARNHVLVEQTRGVAIATTRSIIFSIFALYTTLGKQILSRFPIEYALIGTGIFILIINITFAKKILVLQEETTL